MKNIRLLFLTFFFFLTLMHTGCNKDDSECSNDTEFCAFISSEEYNKTGILIDKYLSNLKTNLSDDEKLKKLKDWMECKSCVANVEIDCVSCIYTNPAKSVLQISFFLNGQQTVKMLYIIMDNPLKFEKYTTETIED